MRYIIRDMLLDIILNALENTLCIENTKIQEMQIIQDIDNFYMLRLVIKDNDYNGDLVKFHISLAKRGDTYVIHNIWVALENNNIKTITPYYYDGLNNLSVALNNTLNDMGLLVEEFKEYE